MNAPHDVLHVSASAVSGRGIGVRLAGLDVLRNVDIEITHGQILALVGPNGAGKSTLLGVLSGDLTPHAGTVEVLGRDLRQWRLRELARERAVLTQEHRIAFPFPVIDVVQMGRAPWRGRPEEDDDDAVVAEAMETTGVTGLAERSFSVLSGGEKGRTSFARIQAQDTGILLLDEPTAALDIGHQELVLGRARREADSGSAVVVVLHDLSLAAAWSDQVLLLDEGRVAAYGSPADVFTAERLSAVYDYPIAVLSHPATGDLIVVPDRAAAANRASVLDHTPVTA